MENVVVEPDFMPLITTRDSATNTIVFLAVMARVRMLADEMNEAWKAASVTGDFNYPNSVDYARYRQRIDQLYAIAEALNAEAKTF